MRKIDLQLFTTPTNTTVDVAPAISIDHANRLNGNIAELQELLGITELEPMSAGTAIKIYKMTQANTPDQVAAGETIALTEIKRTVANTIELTLKKYRKSTPAETIQKSGKDVALNKTDEKLISGVQKDIKKTFYATLEKGTGSATGVGLQKTLAAVWAKVKKAFEDEDATPIFFVSSDDVAEYLGSGQITLQTAFGMSYVEDFLGLGTLVVSPTLTAKKVIGTAKENLHGAYVPANSGDVATTFGLTSDATGMVGMCHSVKTDNASIETLVMSGVVFFPELADGVIVGTITGASDA